MPLPEVIDLLSSCDALTPREKNHSREITSFATLKEADIDSTVNSDDDNNNNGKCDNGDDDISFAQIKTLITTPKEKKRNSSLETRTPNSLLRDIAAKEKSASKEIKTPVFDAFREQWLKFDARLKRREPYHSQASPASDGFMISAKLAGQDEFYIISDSPQAIENTIQSPEIIRKKIRSVKARKGDAEIAKMITLDKEEKNDIEKNSPPPRLPQSLLFEKLDRPPKNKAQSLCEICMLVDDRLFLKHSKIFSNLQSQIKLQPMRLLHEKQILWRRTPYDSTIDGPTPFVLFLLEAQDVYTQLENDNDATSVNQFIQKLKLKAPPSASQVYVLVIGGKSFSNKRTAEINKEFKKCVVAGKKLHLTPTKSLPSWADLEQLLWLQGLDHKVHFQFLDRIDDQLSAHLLEQTKSIAWEPYAHSHRTLDFCAIGGNKKSGNDLKQTWKLILEEIGRVTPSVSETIIQSFPTIRSLLSQYSSRTSVEAEGLLANLTCNGRAIGLALSRKIYKLFITLDPDQLFTHL